MELAAKELVLRLKQYAELALETLFRRNYHYLYKAAIQGVKGSSPIPQPEPNNNSKLLEPGLLKAWLFN